MGYQTSEAHEEFRAQPGIGEPHDPALNPRGFLIEGHLKSGLSQVFFTADILYHVMRNVKPALNVCDTSHSLGKCMPPRAACQFMAGNHCTGSGTGR